MNQDDMAALAQRCARLEAIEDIKQLKARYLNACDRQDPEAVRACFAEGQVIIDMADFGHCSNRDEFVDGIFVPRGCHDHVLDMHHCTNPEITLLDAQHARGVWGLNYRNINTEQRTLTLLSAMYHDEYRKEHGEWKISGSRTEYKTVMVCRYEPGGLQVEYSGRSMQF